MNRRRFIALGIGFGALGEFSPNIIAQELSRVERKGIALGTEVSLLAYHQDRVQARRAVDAAFKALDAIEDLLSLYRPHSEISRLNRDGHLKQAHADTLKVVTAALEWSRMTDGAFDPTVQPLWSLHSKAAPTPEQVESVRRLADWKQVRLNEREIRLGPNQQITLNGIAPGFAADRVREIFVAHGIQHALINTGEFCAVGPKPEGSPWRIGVQHPRLSDAYAILAAVQDRFFATSGDYETKFSEDFSRHHIFNPATGQSPSDLSSVTILAPTGMEADALSTAVFVLGPTRGLDLVRKQNNVDAFLILKNGASIATPNFPKLA